ncbi:acylglycerol kinase, mitochondrial [Phlebotomus argentipes]|uniref:acylglycerol kinase, mitochondrial n=1 Tax=Phlebotomus argentipes TaxID=94469 RepID=UPI002893708E|nr:acylglycerol kinase, mitochondrial [Phlebotomus argentipes]
MAFAVKFAKTVRNHWKKSLFAAALVTYGASYANDTIKINSLMRQYCLEASASGDIAMPMTRPLKEVLVLLNPAANRRSAEETFKKYCEPILHSAGFLVNIVKTDSEGHARRYIEALTQYPNAIVVAGGDGTLSEVITGVMRNTGSNEGTPIGILPLGRTNASCTQVHKLNRVEKARELAEAAISVVRGNVSKRHVMKIEVVAPDEEEHRRPVFAVGSFQWGAFRDILSLRDQYWYVGPLREYLAFLVNAFSAKPTWECEAHMKYTPPCPGCLNCRTETKRVLAQKDKWWSRFIPRSTVSASPATGDDFAKIINESCTKEYTIDGNHSEVIIETSEPMTAGSLQIKLSELENSSFSFIYNSWKRVQSNPSASTAQRASIDARTVEILPEKKESAKEKYYSIDNEEYDVKPIKITLLKHAINMFMPQAS